MQFNDGENTRLYVDMEERIDAISSCEKYKTNEKKMEILRREIPEAKFNIEYFFRTHH